MLYSHHSDAASHSTRGTSGAIVHPSVFASIRRAPEQDWASCGNPTKYLFVPIGPSVWMAVARVVSKTWAGGGTRINCLRVLLSRGVLLVYLMSPARESWEGNRLRSVLLVLCYLRQDGMKERSKMAKDEPGPLLARAIINLREILNSRSRSALTGKVIFNRM